MKYRVSPLKNTVLGGLQRSLGAPCHAQTFLQSILKAGTGVMKNSKCCLVRRSEMKRDKWDAVRCLSLEMKDI